MSGEPRTARKLCGDCREVKAAAEFYTRKRILKDGTIALYLTACCIPCTKKQSVANSIRRRSRRIGA